MFKKPICPCCKAPKKKDDYKFVVETISSLFESKNGWNEFFFGADKDKAIKAFINGDNWACDTCIESQAALRASPENQMYCDYRPFLSYFDRQKVCDSCTRSFLFSKEEQLFWYEELQFWVQSEAVNCKECRAKKRKRKEKIKQAQERLKELLPNLDTGDINQLAEIIENYKLTESHKRVSQYQAILQKLKDKPSQEKTS